MPFPETLDRNPRIIFFTDFDGTITLKDSTHTCLHPSSSLPLTHPDLHQQIPY